MNVYEAAKLARQLKKQDGYSNEMIATHLFAKGYRPKYRGKALERPIKPYSINRLLLANLETFKLQVKNERTIENVERAMSGVSLDVELHQEARPLTTTEEHRNQVLYWKGKYERLVSSLVCLAEDVELEHKNRKVSKIPISASNIYYISNDLDCCDNERYARVHWGKGKYIAAVRMDDGPGLVKVRCDRNKGRRK